MDEETRLALEGSIQKWESIVAGTGEDNGADNCPLCDKFAEGDEERGDCDGCPVKEKVGRIGCVGTPYIQWASFFDAGFPYRADNAAKKTAAQRELDFLISLRPTADEYA